MGRALEEIARLRPDIVLLDIRMPEVSGIELLARLCEQEHRPAVILTTAHEQFAVRAFDLEAVDYVLKPIVARRCVAALERARRAVELRRAERQRRDVVVPTTASDERLEHLIVRSGTTLTPVNLSSVTNVEAQDDYVLLHAAGRGHLAGIRMREMEQRLPNPPFVRVHRSHIVNLDFVRCITCGSDGRLSVQMMDGQCLPVSRDRARQVRRLIR